MLNKILRKLTTVVEIIKLATFIVETLLHWL